MISRARLPGVRFETAPPPPADVLPRTDVGVFVGFAASGPLDLPVAVEDAAAFADVFGPDAPLAWDPDRGERAFALLGPAVRAFFRNGGQRCWVIRVAGMAVGNVFPVPGLATVDNNGVIRPAFARARSEGSWSDDLSVGTSLAEEFVDAPSDPLAVDQAKPSVRLRSATRPDVAAGDLLRLSYEAQGYELLFEVRAVDSVEDASLPGRAVRVARGGQAIWLLAASGRKPGPDEVRLNVFPSVGPPAILQAQPVLDDGAWPTTPAETDVSVDVVCTLSAAPKPGTLVQIDFADGPFLLIVRTAVAKAETIDSPPASPLPSPLVSRVRLTGSGWWQKKTPPPDPLPPPSRVTRLTFEMRVRQGDEVRRLGGMGFAREHASFWGSLPTDADLYCDNPAPSRYAGLWDAASAPHRFPLAGSVTGLSLPLGMLPFADTHLGPEPPTAGPLERDGLAPFDHAVFLGAGDLEAFRALTGASAGRLLREADYFRWSGPNPRTLKGVYAALGVDEAALIAIPDAVHRGWSLVTAAVPCVATPEVKNTEPLAQGFGPCGIVSPPPAAVPPSPIVTPKRWEVNPVAGYSADGLFKIQRALLRVCVARGDLFAVLALPEHYREPEATGHSAELASSIGLTTRGDRGTSDRLNAGEVTALSYGAVYHPWLLGREENDLETVRRIPPDGAACGVMAKRSLTRGPWVAPANVRLRGVVGLVPEIDPRARLDLQEARVNLVRQEPRGFLALTAATLHPDDDLRDINVRRLLILLRRLCLRVGAEFVFEANSPAFRRSVKRGFEEVLGFLFARGAFAGRSPDEGFRVNVGDEVNPPGGVEQGRFVVELRVAPSRPLTFLTVRLVQTADRGTVAEGA